MESKFMETWQTI